MRPATILAPGSFVWLVALDMRLNWRRFADMLGGIGWLGFATLLTGGAIVLHLVAWPAFIWGAPHLISDGMATTPLAVAMLCIFTWMIAQGLFGITRTLYDRGDLDLLLGSPLPAWRILAAKTTAVAASTLGSLGLLVLPFANAGALLGHPMWLMAYPVLVSFALLATALGLGLSLGLFFLFGPRRARMYTQLIGALIAGGFVLGAQIAAILPDHIRVAIAAWLETVAPIPGTPLHKLFSSPVAALLGDLLALELLMVLAVLLFALAVMLLANHFAAATLAASGAPTDSHRRHKETKEFVFHGGLGRNLRRKEWRLLARDPSVFSQLGLQIIYTIPIAVVLLRSEALPTALALAPAIVVIATQVSSSLAWLMVSGEDAPELMAAAPVSAAEVDRAKLTAVGLPVLLIVALPMAGLAYVSWQAALVTLTFVLAGATSTALLNFWHPMPGSRRGMLRRHSQSKLIALIEHALAILWAMAVVLTLIGSLLAIVPAALTVGILSVVRNRHRRTTLTPSTVRTKVPGIAPIPDATART